MCFSSLGLLSSGAVALAGFAAIGPEWIATVDHHRRAVGHQDC